MDWSLEDYPLYITHQASTPPNLSTIKLVPWHASLVSWTQMFATGDTEAEALADLRQRFADYKQQHESLPRPGTSVLFEVASSDAIEHYDALARDFLVASWRELRFCLLSDLSSLGDSLLEDNEQFFQKIRNVYGVDVSGIDDGNLVQIFKRIVAHQDAS